MYQKTIPTKPLNRIALTLSGGGYRAAAFHLGMMDYLNRTIYNEKPLLEAVDIISTVSGGTICGAYYAWNVTKEKGFDAFYKGLYDLMKKFDLIEAGLNKINNKDKDAWKPHKNRNLINAFAQIYDQELFREDKNKQTDGDTFGIFVDLEKEELSLKEVIFNTTEFKHGLPFRFQNTGLCGNKMVNLTNDEMWEVALGDIVAASSCFPSGFEPLAFPDDSNNPDNLKNLNVGDFYDSENLENNKTYLTGLTEEGYKYHRLYQSTEKLSQIIKKLESKGKMVKAIKQRETLKDLASQLKYPDNARKQQFCYGPIGLMDGGIVDNQGIGSMLEAESRRRNRLKGQKEKAEKWIKEVKKEVEIDDKTAKDLLLKEKEIRELSDQLSEKQIDLLIISDVSGPYMQQLKLANYEEANKNKKTSNLQRLFGRTREAFLDRMKLLGIISLIMGLSLLVTGFAYTKELILISSIFILLGGFLFTAGGIILLLLPAILKDQYQKTLRALRRKMGKPTEDDQNYNWMEFLPPFMEKYIPSILKIEFDTWSPMLLDRANSVVTMVSEVFMKQIRRLIYDKVWSDPNWQYRFIDNFIYELREEDHNKKMRKKDGDYTKDALKLSPELREPGKNITDAAAKASSMGTTLWFTKEEKEEKMIEHLIACGQFAICYNLLEYLELLQRDPNYAEHPDKAKLDQLHNEMMKDWKNFKENPFFMTEGK